MSITQLMTLLTQLTVILIAIQALVAFLHHRDQARFDVLLMFGDLGVIVLFQWLTQATNNRIAWFGTLGSLLLVAHPYLLLRLTQYLRRVPREVRWTGLIGMVASWLIILAFPNPTPAGMAILIVAYFVFIEVYAVISLVRGAFITSGVTHWRLLLAAIGSGLIGILILLSGFVAAFPAWSLVLAPLMQLVSLLSVISYYLGFAPPAWLRRAWQLSELHHYLLGSTGHLVGEPVDDVLRRLCIAAERAVGGFASAVTLWNEEQHRLDRYIPAVDEQLASEINLDHPLLEQVWREQESRIINFSTLNMVRDQEPVVAQEASALLAIPIKTRERAWGLLMIFVRHTPLFASDDLSLLSLLSDQTATYLSYVDLLTEQQKLIEQFSRYNRRLQALNEIGRAILAARSPHRVAHAALSHLRSLIPSFRASVVLFDNEAQTAHFLAVNSDSGLWPQEGSFLPLDNLPSFETVGKSRIYIHDLASLEHRTPYLERLVAQGIHSFVAEQLIAEGKLIGMLKMVSKDPDAFQAEHQDIVREVADQLALTIQQARLREELQGYTVELEQRVADRTQQLETANKELEAFAYSVSHDLRAPLRAIDGFSRLLLEKYVAELPEEAARYLHLVRMNTQQMGQLIDDLLSFSRLSRQPLNKQNIEPSGLVRVVLRDLLREKNGRQVEIVMGQLPPCKADLNLLKQVFTNLLSNALKYTSKRPIARIEIGCEVIDGQEYYFVKDNGVGFDMQYANKLFRVFQRLHRAEDYEGTGVGLAIVQRIINRHGGHIWAQAELDKGATFYFSLPSGEAEPVTN